MQKIRVLLTLAVLAVSSPALAQQQYDSLGSPTPRPNQAASPNDKPANVPVPGNQNPYAVITGSGVGVTTARGDNSATGGGNQPSTSGAADSTTDGVGNSAQPPNKTGVTPSGITPD